MVIQAQNDKERCCQMSKKLYNSIIKEAFENGLLPLQRFYFRVGYKRIHIY